MKKAEGQMCCSVEQFLVCRGKWDLGQVCGFYPIRIHLFSEKKWEIIYFITTFRNPSQLGLRSPVFFPTAIFPFFNMKKGKSR